AMVLNSYKVYFPENISSSNIALLSKKYKLYNATVCLSKHLFNSYGCWKNIFLSMQMTDLSAIVACILLQ
ncbi:hypothetical protein KC220_25545, partial [Mycobacterium tuberculosis]|nr:hypothetical protein [Mycobacterium tuberculosis]